MNRDFTNDHRIKIQELVSQLHSDGAIRKKTYQFLISGGQGHLYSICFPKFIRIKPMS